MAAQHQWQFVSRFRARSFGWRASQLAATRLKEAVSEIRKVGRKDLPMAAEGAIRLIERLWPALEHIDGSSGLLGSSVNQTVHEVLAFPIQAQVDAPVRSKWLDRLWTAYMEDGVDYTAEVADRWGELCASQSLREKWLAELYPGLLTCWSLGTAGGYYRGSTAVFSCLFSLGRYQELLDLITRSPSGLWYVRRYGVKALVAMGRHEEALRYAEASRDSYSGSSVDRDCEDILLSLGRRDEAYSRFAQAANQRTTGLATFGAIAEKYPEKPPREILADLIRSTPGREGKWFATARKLGFVELAVNIAQRFPCDPRTLNRAADDLGEKQPAVALEIAIASLRWMCEGFGYEISGMDVHAACSSAVKAAKAVYRLEDTVQRIMKMTQAHAQIHQLCKGVVRLHATR
jgi:tetratricopeptide (TPR) repeat protein